MVDGTYILCSTWVSSLTTFFHVFIPIKMSLAELRGALGVIGITGITGITRVTNTFSLTRAHTKQVELHPQEESTDPKAGVKWIFLLPTYSNIKCSIAMENPRISRRWLENAGKWWEDHASPIENWIWFRFNYHLEGSIPPVEHWDSDLAAPRSASIWSRSILAGHAVPSIFPPKYLPRSHGFVLDSFISRAFFRTFICVYSHRQNYGKKNVSIYRRRLSMIEKLRTFVFP